MAQYLSQAERKELSTTTYILQKYTSAIKEKLGHPQVKENKGSFLLIDMMLKEWLNEVL